MNGKHGEEQQAVGLCSRTCHHAWDTSWSHPTRAFAGDRAEVLMGISEGAMLLSCIIKATGSRLAPWDSCYMACFATSSTAWFLNP